MSCCRIAGNRKAYLGKAEPPSAAKMGSPCAYVTASRKNNFSSTVNVIDRLLECGLELGEAYDERKRPVNPS